MNSLEWNVCEAGSNSFDISVNMQIVYLLHGNFPFVILVPGEVDINTMLCVGQFLGLCDLFYVNIDIICVLIIFALQCKMTMLFGAH